MKVTTLEVQGQLPTGMLLCFGAGLPWGHLRDELGQRPSLLGVEMSFCPFKGGSGYLGGGEGVEMRASHRCSQIGEGGLFIFLGCPFPPPPWPLWYPGDPSECQRAVLAEGARCQLGPSFGLCFPLPICLPH